RPAAVAKKPVAAKPIKAETLEQARESIRAKYAAFVRAGKMSREDAIKKANEELRIWDATTR
ncbi:MAG: hypothetical protein AB1715_14305, partial [Acidobacteriota bacterium]